MVLVNGGVFLFDGLGEGEDLVDLVKAVVFLIGLAAGVGTCSFLIEVEAGLKRTANIPSLLPLVKPNLHLIKQAPQVLVLLVDPTQVVVQKGYLQTLGLILFFQALGVFVEEGNPLLKMFVRCHITILI